ncbi:MAG TPA: ABC transporter permease [Burkholderiaceae bacterium]|nr:ABC transporter permease [Burkholderiaceae bacterium]
MSESSARDPAAREAAARAAAMGGVVAGGVAAGDAAAQDPAVRDLARRPGPGRLAWQRLLGDRVGVVSLAVVVLSLLLVATAAAGWIGAGWNDEVAVSHAPPVWWRDAGGAPADPSAGERAAAVPADAPARAGVDAAVDRPTAVPTITDPLGLGADEPTPVPTIVDPIGAELAQVRAALDGRAANPAAAALRAALPMGADRWGRDVLAKTIKGAQTSVLVGLGAALVATLIGTVLGALAGYHGGRVDDAMNWLYNVFTSLPPILLILAIAAVLAQRSLLSVVLILAFTSWTGVFRIVRAEYLRHAVRDYVRAARAIGASPLRRMVVHILPNVAGVILVQFTLLAVACIKYEVILSFLGFGVPVDGVSWGTMLIEAQNDLLTGRWWQLLSATVAMALFVSALSLLADAVRDALDPRLRQRT